MEATAKKATGEEESSMEDILQSIRKIIAEDDTPGETKTNGQKANGMSEVPGSEVLELTEMVAEPAASAAAPAAPAAISDDVLSKIDEALAGNKPAAVPATPAAAPAAAPVAPAVADGNSLISEQTTAAAVAALRKLEPTLPGGSGAVTASPRLRSGTTIEDMVIEMLRPMVKQWLDTNLPSMVERIVEREVRKLRDSY